MQRRAVIKQLAFVTGASFFLPSCLHKKSKPSVQLKNIFINDAQEKQLAALSETLIPTTGTPGAKEVSAHLFALTMMDDCYKKQEQELFITGLAAFEKKTQEQFVKPYNECSLTQKETLLNELEKYQPANTPLAYFYSNFKKLTIQAYTGSKFYLTVIQKYELVPGHFYGCVPLKSAL